MKRLLCWCWATSKFRKEKKRTSATFNETGFSFRVSLFCRCRVWGRKRGRGRWKALISIYKVFGYQTVLLWVRKQCGAYCTRVVLQRIGQEPSQVSHCMRVAAAAAAIATVPLQEYLATKRYKMKKSCLFCTPLNIYQHEKQRRCFLFTAMLSPQPRVA